MSNATADQMLDLEQDAVSAIHDGTAVYTARPEVEALLDGLGWPACGGAVMDPACGDGNILIAALDRITLARNDVDALAARLSGVEFHPPTARRARERLADRLLERGWNPAHASRAAELVVEERDFLLTPTRRTFPAICANPPYLRRVHLPEGYRQAFDAAVPKLGRADMMHAFIDRMATLLAPGGRMALITSDRWLLNSGAADLRDALGRRLAVTDVQRLDAASAFHRPKERRRGTPPRVHPVSVLLGSQGSPIGRAPFRIGTTRTPEGIPFSDIADIRLAPWLGPDGIFTVDDAAGLPPECLVPAVEPQDIDPRTDEIGPTRRWAIVTGDAEPPPAVMAHLRRTMARMPARGRRAVPWHPPERFDGRLPLDEDAVLVPRIAPRLRAVPLPKGALALNHSLVICSGRPPAEIRRILTDPRVREQADALALMVDGGYRSYTATLLRQLVIPEDLVDARRAA